VRHVPAEILFETAVKANCEVSTVYSRNYTVRLDRRDGANWTKITDTGAAYLSPGSYRVAIDPHQNDISIFYALPEVPKLMTGVQLRARLRRKEPSTGPVLKSVKLTLTPSR